MRGNTTQDAGKFQFALVYPTFFCDLHDPQRNKSEIELILQSTMCSFHCCAKSASALAQGKSCAGAGTAGISGELWTLSWYSHGTSILEPLDTNSPFLAHTRALQRYSVFFSLLLEFFKHQTHWPSTQFFKKIQILIE